MILGDFSCIGMAANSCNIFTILKLKPKTCPWKSYNLQREISFSMRNWLTILHGGIGVKWISVSIKHIKNVLYFCKSKGFMFHVPIFDHIQTYCF